MRALDLRSKILVGAVLALGAATSCNLNPVQRAAVNNLGDEQGDLYPPESEYHRPGEPCALCHSKDGPADSEYALAGTIFWGPDNYERRVANAYVRILDANKSRKCFVTNCNGNFFVRKQDYESIKFPMLVSVERTKKPGEGDETTLAIQRMGGHIGREASCATCHILGLRDFASPGQIFMYPTEDEVKTVDPPVMPCPPPPEARVVTRCPEDR